MANLLADIRFLALYSASETVIDVLSKADVPDAVALADRLAGVHHLQGHAQRIIPLTIWLVKYSPDILGLVRNNTELTHDMGSRGSAEARATFWNHVKAELIANLNRHGSDIVASRGSPSGPRRSREIAKTYLSQDYGGSHGSGKAGNTVLKRTLKLLAHILPL